MSAELKLPRTELQSRVLSFTYDFIQKHLYPPTVIEIQKGLYISNPGTVHKALMALQKKGYVSKEKGMARGLRLTPLGEEVCSQEKQMKLELESYQSSKTIQPTGGNRADGTGNLA